MYLLIIGWMYVVLMMAVAEATNSNGTVLGAIVTFVLYGLLPSGLLAYLMGTPARNRRNKKLRAEAELAFAQQASSAPAVTQQSPESSAQPDAGGHPASGAAPVAAHADPSVTPVRKES